MLSIQFHICRRRIMEEVIQYLSYGYIQIMREANDYSTPQVASAKRPRWRDCVHSHWPVKRCQLLFSIHPGTSAYCCLSIRSSFNSSRLTPLRYVAIRIAQGVNSKLQVHVRPC